jgi:hypothetical protein
MCSRSPLQPRLRGRIVGVNWYFDPPVDAQTALAAVASTLPADIQQLRSVEGVNADYSKYHDGSCQQVIYASNALAAAVRQASPQWTADPHEVSARFITATRPLATVRIGVISRDQYIWHSSSSVALVEWRPASNSWVGQTVNHVVTGHISVDS